MQNFLKIGGGQMSMTSIPRRLIGRFFKPKPIKPIGIDKWPNEVKTNCFGFAIGHTEPLEIWKVNNLDLNPIQEVGGAFESKLRGLGYKVPRRISKLVEANEDEFVLAVFGFASYEIKLRFRKQMVIGDFHVVRRELDGTWVHKPGWYQAPRGVSQEDEADIRSKFDVSKVALFAFQAPSK